MKSLVADKDYKQWIGELSSRYRQSQIKAAVKVNSEMLHFYWLLGHDIVERQMENTYGSGFFNSLSADLQRELPDAKGFSPTNIKYFKYFYELYSSLLGNRPQVADELNSEIVNHQLKGEGDNPTIGLLICKYKDSVEAQYALESTSQPIGVSAYQLSKLIPEKFKSSLPSIEELESVLIENK